jgi:hypothetical protein
MDVIFEWWKGSTIRKEGSKKGGTKRRSREREIRR